MPNPVIKYLDLEPCRFIYIIYIRYLIYKFNSIVKKMLEEGWKNPKYCLSCHKIGEDKTDFIFHN